MAGQGQVLAADQAARPVRSPRRWPWPPPAASGGACDPRGPQDGAHLVPGDVAVVVLDLDAAQVGLGDDRAHVQLDAELAPGRGRPARTASGRTMASGALPPSNSRTRASSGWMCRYSSAQRLGGDLADLPGQLHPGRPGPDQGEGEPALPFGRVGGGLGQLERAEHPPPDLHRVLDRLHPGRERRRTRRARSRTAGPRRPGSR